MQETSLSFYPSMPSAPLELPLFSVKVSAGMPCPADDHVDDLLDLNDHLIQHPNDTFFVRVEGESMINASIHDGDLLIVDRSLKPKHDSIVIAQLNGEFTVKRISIQHNRLLLMPENSAYSPIEVSEDMDFKIWGVVTNVIHALT